MPEPTSSEILSGSPQDPHFESGRLDPLFLQSFALRYAAGDLNAKETEAFETRLANDQDARATLLLVSDLGLVRQIPPRHILADQFRPAAPIDGSVAHNGAARRMVCEDQGTASVAFFVDDAAGSRLEIVIAGITRREHRCARIHHQGHLSLQMNRCDEKDVISAAANQLDRLARWAAVDRFLDALGIERFLTRRGRDSRFEDGAIGCGKMRFDHRSKILRVDGGGDQQQ